MSTKIEAADFLDNLLRSGKTHIMEPQRMQRIIAALPLEGQKQVIDFILFLQQRYGPEIKKQSKKSLKDESFIGMWADREDLQDSINYTRKLRAQEWG